MTYMTVLMPLSCWNICRPQPTTSALRVGPWRRIRRTTGPSTPAGRNKARIHSWYICSRFLGHVTRPLTSASLPLLVHYARLDAFVFHIHAPTSSDLAENIECLLSPTTL